MLAICSLISWSASAAQDVSNGWPVSITTRGQFSYGAMDGFVQMPAGGTPGSSSPERPTLDELDIDSAGFYDVLAAVNWRSWRLYAGYQAIPLDGSATLTRDLVSRNVAFPAGTRVSSEIDVNWFRAGAAYRFRLLDERLELMPKAEVAFVDFGYDLSGGGQAVDRSFMQTTIRLGLEARYRLHRIITAVLSADGALPIANMPQVASITGGFEFDLWPDQNRVRPVLFLGGGAQRINYEDDQSLPNHFHLDMGPYGTVGLGISF